MLVDGPVEIGPRTGDLQVRLVGEPPVTRGMTARAGGLDELRGEPLYPPVDGDVVNGNAALGEQLFDVTVGQAVPQVPPDRERDHLRREPEACENRGRAACSHQTSLRPSTIDECNSAFAPTDEPWMLRRSTYRHHLT
jgi:hypothetical protein